MFSVSCEVVLLLVLRVKQARLIRDALAGQLVPPRLTPASPLPLQMLVESALYKLTGDFVQQAIG